MTTRHAILEIIDNHKESIGDGDYLKICNLIKNLNETPNESDEIQELKNRINSYQDKLIETLEELLLLKKEIRILKRKIKER